VRQIFLWVWMATFLLMWVQPVIAADSVGLDTARIEELTGAKGTLDAKEGVFKVAVPHPDLAVNVGGVHLTPGMGLTSWAAFKHVGAHTIVMGDLVLLEGQVNPIMSIALDSGLEVTALHNHFLFESPRVMFMHILGMGEERSLATAVGKVFKAIKETRTTPEAASSTSIDPVQSSLDPNRVAAVLGHEGQLKDGIYKVTIGRSTRAHGSDVGSTMGVNTWAAFAGSDEQAVVDGDFAMLESELQPVLKALRKSDINIVAIHQHMTGEQPRIMFLHYWGIGKAEDLARGLRLALDRTATAESSPR
jgi:hypothetical protein